MEQEDLFSSSSKKYSKYSSNSDDYSDGVIRTEYGSCDKGHKHQLKKFINEFALLDDIEKQLDELQDSITSTEPKILIDLTSKLNIGKEILNEVQEIMQTIDNRNLCSSVDFSVYATETKRAQEILDQMKQYKLKMPDESSQLSYIISLRIFFEKIIRALKLDTKANKNTKSNDQENKQFDEHLKFIQDSILSNDSLGQKLELDQLNGLYVDLLSIIDLAQKTPLNNRASKVKLVKYLEDKFTEAIWIKKATDLKNSDTTSVIQIPYSKFNDILRQAPKQSAKAISLLENLEVMKTKYLSYFNAFKEIESQIDEKKITSQTSKQLKSLQSKLQKISTKYKDVPYALKLDIKQKQQYIEKIVDSINWSINAKEILEERVDSIEKLEQILVEQTQKQLQPSQKMLIKDINERISTVKKSNSQLAIIQEQEQTSSKSSDNETKKQLSVEVFIDLLDTYKDLNQYINLDTQLNQVEDYLKSYQSEEFSLLKLTKNWMNRLNEENLDLKSFKIDLDSISQILKKSLFEWTKYEANIKGLEVAYQIKQIIQSPENEECSIEEEEEKSSNQVQMSLINAIELKNQILLLDQKENYVLKNFEGKAIFLQLIEDFQTVKMDLDNMSKKSITSERLDEMCKIMCNTFIQSSSDKQRLLKIKQMKDKVLSEMKDFETASYRKEKVDIKRIYEVLDTIKQCGVKLDDKKVQLERKIHIANQIIRIFKSSPNFDVDKVIEQYNNQSVQIDIVEEMLIENKQINNDLEEFEEKMMYNYEDYEDLIELNQKLNAVKLHFSRKRMLQLLKQKVFTLLTILIWKNWNEKRQLFGLNLNSLKNILKDSQIYDEFIIINKTKIKQLKIFSNEQENKQKIMPNHQKAFNSSGEKSINSSGEKSLNLSGVKAINSSGEKVINSSGEKTQNSSGEKGINSSGEKGIFSSGEKGINSSGENGINSSGEKNIYSSGEKAIKPKNDLEDKMEIEEGDYKKKDEMEEEQQEDEEDEVIRAEKKLKNIQQIIVDERVQVDVSILKECRDAIKNMWEQVMKRVKLIRETTKSSEIEKLENQYAYTLGCVDLMDIIIEQKILIQGKEEKHQDFLQQKYKVEQQQKQMKEQQYQAAQQQIQQQRSQISQTKAHKANKYQQNSLGVIQSVTIQKYKMPETYESKVQNLLKNQTFSLLDKHQIKLAKKLVTSMVSNPFYKDLHISLVENTVSFLIKKIYQFKYSQDYISQILEFFEELKEDFYLSEQYRKESFSFRCFSTLMRLNSSKLIDLIKLKKRKLNEDEEKTEKKEGQDQEGLSSNIKQPQMNSKMNSDEKIYQKKIIDHEEYISLNYKFSNTQIRDPLFKEFYRLMNSKENLAQFRKMQQELKKISGETEFNAADLPYNDSDEEEDENKKKEKCSQSKSSASRSSIGSVSKISGQFSSEDEEEYQQEIIQSHPSVLKYINKESKDKKLLDPIKENEMDSFINFCNHQLRQKLNNQSGQIRIMYNPLTNDEEIISKTQSKNDQYGFETDTETSKIYDPDAIKNMKNIYSLFKGRIHLSPEANKTLLNITCFVESTERIVKQCPVFKYGDIIKQSGESQMFETKEFLIRSYKCETILTLFGSIESQNEEQQKLLDSLAQDLKNRDRVSIALWNNSTKLYIFHKKVFDRDHCGNHLQKKFSLSPSELCFGLVFKPVNLKVQEIEAIERIKEPVLYASSPADFLELQAVKTAQRKDNEELGNIPTLSLFDTDKKPKFKKPLPKYRKDTILKIYVPIKDSDDASGQSETNGNNLLKMLLKPKTKEIERRIEQISQKTAFQSQFQRQQQSVITSIKTPQYQPEIEEFFRRKINGKRTVKQSLNKLDDIFARTKNPNRIKPDTISHENIFENINGQIDNLQTTLKKSISKKSVSYSDKLQVEDEDEEDEELQQQQQQQQQQEQQYDDDGDDDYADYGQNDYNGINDFQVDLPSEVSPLKEPVRLTELSSVSSLHQNKNYSISSKLSKTFLTNKQSSLSISSLASRYKEDFLHNSKYYNNESVERIESQIMNKHHLQENNNDMKYNQQNRNNQLIDDDDDDDQESPIYSKSSISSVSQNSIANNRQKLLEFASILDQIRPSFQSQTSVSHQNVDLDKISELSKVSSLKSRKPYSTVSKITRNSVSQFDNNSYDSEGDLYTESEEQQYRNFNNYQLRNNYMDQDISDAQPSDVSPLQSSDKNHHRYSQSFSSNISIPKTKLFQQNNLRYDNKENINLNQYQNRDMDTDGVSTPQLSLSKDSYSKISISSQNEYSGKRSYSNFNNFQSNKLQKASNSYEKKNSKFSAVNYQNNKAQYDQNTEFDKQTPVLENFVNNKFRNEDNSQSSFMKNSSYTNQSSNYQKKQNTISQPTQNRPQALPSAFIYEQDNYQFNSKIFTKSMQKSANKNNQAQNQQDKEDLDSENSSINSKVNEHQLLGLRNQLDSLLSVIQSKKTTFNIGQ